MRGMGTLESCPWAHTWAHWSRGHASRGSSARNYPGRGASGCRFPALVVWFEYHCEASRGRTEPRLARPRTAGAAGAQPGARARRPRPRPPRARAPHTAPGGGARPARRTAASDNAFSGAATRPLWDVAGVRVCLCGCGCEGRCGGHLGVGQGVQRGGLDHHAEEGRPEQHPDQKVQPDPSRQLRVCVIQGAHTGHYLAIGDRWWW